MMSITTEALNALRELNATLSISTVTIFSEKYAHIKLYNLKHTEEAYISMKQYKQEGALVLILLFQEFKENADKIKSPFDKCHKCRWGSLYDTDGQPETLCNAIDLSNGEINVFNDDDEVTVYDNAKVVLI